MRGFNCLSYFFIRKLGRPHKSRSVVMSNWSRQQCDFIYNKLCVDGRMMWGINLWTQTELWLSVGGSSVSVCLVRLVTAFSFILLTKHNVLWYQSASDTDFLCYWSNGSLFPPQNKKVNTLFQLYLTVEFISHDCNFIFCYLTLYFTVATLFLLIRTEYLAVTTFFATLYLTMWL